MKGKPLNDPRVPTAQSKQYLTAYYIKFDAQKHSGVRPPTKSGRELSLSSWACYPLFAEDVSEISGIPKGCRLDDRTLAAEKFNFLSSARIYPSIKPLTTECFIRYQLVELIHRQKVPNMPIHKRFRIVTQSLGSDSIGEEATLQERF